jgi:hypothetical protein
MAYLNYCLIVYLYEKNLEKEKLISKFGDQ